MVLNVKNNNISNEKIMRNIKKELNYLGYISKYCGTKYLEEVIYILYNNENINNLQKEVYPIIASKYNKSVNTIKCNIITATSIMIDDCEERKLLKYLGYYEFSRPGPKQIAESVISKLRSKKINKLL